MSDTIYPTLPRRLRGARALRRVRIQDITPNPSQPRRHFPESSIAELAESIRRCGLLSPLVVRPVEFGYELIAGERRLRALKLLQAEETDVIVMNVANQESALLALIENLQRENLSYFEEAEAYQSLIENHHMTREALAERVGRSPSSVANRLRLLKLSPAVRALLTTNALSERHARALLRLNSEREQLTALEKTIHAQLNVRALEQLIEKMLQERIAATQKIRGIYHDHRIFINTMLNTVRTLQASGIGVTSRVTDRPDGVEITVMIPRVDALPHGEERELPSPDKVAL